jgi:hypothetical protein
VLESCKAPWYFLACRNWCRLRLLGGIGIPRSFDRFALIPISTETDGTEWFGGLAAARAASAIFGLAAVLVLEAFVIRFGWIRQWWPAIPQLVITLVNPGTLLTLLYACYSLWSLKKYDSTRAGALALFTCFVCGFVVLTVIGTYFRGPNWDFYWSPSQWPGH